MRLQIDKLFLWIKNYFLKGNQRSLNVKKNIFQSFLIKGGSIVVSLLLVPLLINYLDTTRYGIWITFSSIIAWFSFFDIGLGNGLRNKLAEAIAQKKIKLAKIYVSTTYAILIIIMVSIYIVFVFSNMFINWVSILNAKAGMGQELKALAIIVFTFFCLRLILQLFNIILIADQKPAKSSLFNLIANLSALIIIYLLSKFSSGSLFKVGMVISGMPVTVLFVASVWFFKKDYRLIAPNIKYINFKYSKDLVGLGIKFFIIQIASVVLYQTSNIIIAQLFGPARVTSYYVAFKYFSVVTMVFGIILTPFWSAFTEAKAMHDMQWIKRIVRKLQMLWFLMIGVVIIMLVASGFIFKIWVGNKVDIGFSLSAVIALYVTINAWNSIYSQFLNGMGTIKLQLYSGIWGIVINIPLAIYMGKAIGIEGVILSTCLLGIVNMVWSRIQYLKIINNTATGIWAQ